MNTVYQKFAHLIIAGLFFLLTACATNPTAEESTNTPSSPIAESALAARIEVAPELRSGAPVILKFTLTNNAGRVLYILKWYTPLEGIAGKIFRVERDGEPVPYEGILASRAAPLPEDYVLLEPGASVSAIVDLAKAYDFSQAGTYTIEFLSPQISHLARAEESLARSMDELGPVQIASNQISVEILAPQAEETGKALLPVSPEAAAQIRDYIRRQKPVLNPELELPLMRLPAPETWDDSEGQLYRVTGEIMQDETFLVRDEIVVQLGEATGGWGLTSLEAGDLDQDGATELFYTYSFGSGIHQSRLGMYAPAYDAGRTYEANIGYRGDIALEKESSADIVVRVVELEPSQLAIRYLDILGALAVRRENGQPELVLELAPGLPAEVQQQLIRGE